MEILTRENFIRLWNALFERSSTSNPEDPDNAMKITNGVSTHLGDFLIKCAHGQEQVSLAEKYKV